MNKTKFKVGDLVDLHSAVKLKDHLGLAVILYQEYDDDDRYYALLWSNGYVSLAHRVNILPIIHS